MNHFFWPESKLKEIIENFIHQIEENEIFSVEIFWYCQHDQYMVGIFTLVMYNHLVTCLLISNKVAARSGWGLKHMQINYESQKILTMQ